MSNKVKIKRELSSKRGKKKTPNTTSLSAKLLKSTKELKLDTTQKVLKQIVLNSYNL